MHFSMAGFNGEPQVWQLRSSDIFKSPKPAQREHIQNWCSPSCRNAAEPAMARQRKDFYRKSMKAH